MQLMSFFFCLFRFQSWGGDAHYTQPSELAFTVAQFAAAGGSYQNYYMFHGGSNFGRHASAGITTNYDYDAQLDQYGIHNEPKYSHQAALHGVLNLIAPIIIGYNFSMPNPLGYDVFVYEYGNIGQSNSLFVLSNTNKTNVTLSYHGQSFTISNQTIQIYNGSNYQLLFDTSIIKTQENPLYLHYEADRVLSVFPSVTASSIVWYAEPVGIWSGNGIINTGPLDQVDTTQYRTNYFWLTTSLSLKMTGINNLSLMDAGDNELFFLDNLYLGQGFGADSNKLTTYSLMIPKEIKTGNHQLQILSVMQGMADYGDAFTKRGLNGEIIWNGNTYLRDQSWNHQIGLLGEFLELNTIVGASSHTGWNNSLVTTGPLTWYWLNMTTPTPVGDANRATWQFDLSTMTKGQIYCNGFHLGAYWLIKDSQGKYSQEYYHMPRDYLMPPGQINTVILFEEVAGDPTGVVLQQRDAFTAASDQKSQFVTNSFSYQGSKNVKKTSAAGQISGLYDSYERTGNQLSSVVISD